MTRQLCTSTQGCHAPATWHLTDLFGNAPDHFLCETHLGALGGMAVAQRRGWDVKPFDVAHFTSIEHELGATRKAMRGLRAAIAYVTLPDTADDPLFAGTLADRLEQLNAYLFDDSNPKLAAACWTGLGIVDRRLSGRSEITDFRTSRPLIRDLIAEAIELDRSLS